MRTNNLFFVLVFLLVSITGISQNNAVIINGDYIMLNGGSASAPIYMVVNQSNDSGIVVRSGGWIVSENEYNYVQWNIGSTLGNYTVPFGFSTANYLPLNMKITTPGTISGNGNILFSTYRTNSAPSPNNLPWPSGPPAITNLNNSSGSNNSLKVVDRFWVIDAHNYSANPTSVLQFTYASTPEISGSNTITQKYLKAERWNNTLSTWTDFISGANDSALGKDTGIIVSPANLRRAWILVDSVLCTPFTVSASAAAPTICSGNNTNITASGASNYSWTPATGLNTTSGAVVNATPTITTTYTVTGTNPTGCAPEMNTVIVTVNPTPTVSIAITGISPAVCEGDTIGFIASGATSYTWTPSSGLNSTTGGYVIATPTISTTYTVTGTGTGGCKSTANQSIVVNPTPTITASATPPAICSGNTATLNAGGAVTFVWSPSSSLSASTGSSVTATPGSTITYSVVGTSGTGCKDSATTVVTVTATPTVSIAPSAPTICTGGNVNLVASGATTYTWSPSTDLSTTNGATVIANPTTTTTYTATGTTGACVSTQIVVVTVATKLNVTVTPSSPSICSGGNITLNANGAANFTWSPAAGLNCTTCSNPVASPGTTQTYKVIGTSGSCSDSANVTVTVNTTPTVTAS
ncbi:MAG TPA: hypothetical protein VK890_06805, partial [Bacteroidia bacterium]|nr:hypothetical protein [Bacteroidia bacterium]